MGRKERRPGRGHGRPFACDRHDEAPLPRGRRNLPRSQLRSASRIRRRAPGNPPRTGSRLRDGMEPRTVLGQRLGVRLYEVPERPDDDGEHIVYDLAYAVEHVVYVLTYPEVHPGV